MRCIRTSDKFCNTGMLSLGLVAVLLLTTVAYLTWPQKTAAAATELFISEYIEGSSNNKAIEIYNDTGSAVDLATGSYNIQMFFNGNPLAGLTINLSGTVAHGDVFVIAQSSANATIVAQADQTNGAGWFNGDDAVVLRKGTTIIDAIGQVGFDPGTEWGSGLTSTADNTLRRKVSVSAGDTNATDVFDPAVEWDGFATDTFDNLGCHLSGCVDAAPSVVSTSPTDNATGVATNSNIVVNFSEPVSLGGNAFSISCTDSGSHTMTVNGNAQSTSFTIDPDVDFALTETCIVTVIAGAVSDQDASDPPDNLASDYVFSFTTSDNPCTRAFTPIYTVQGNGNTSPLVNTSGVSVRGIVTGDFQGSTNLNGFYLQDATGDGDPATSDGIFVFAPGSTDVNVGDELVVTGQVVEFSNLTEISNVTEVAQCGFGTVVPTAADLPQVVAGEFERFEGMLVTFPETLTVSEIFTLGRFGEVTLSSDGRLFQPTQLTEPGPLAIAQAADNALRRIILDDGKSIQNPNPIPYLGPDQTLRAGDTVSNVTGILDFRFSEYRVQPTVSPSFNYQNARTVVPDSVGGNLKVASLNVLNYFNGDGTGGGFPTSRGADSAQEFDRQRAKIIAAITAIDADVVGIIEIENDGGGPTSAIRDLVNGLNSATAPGTYAFSLGTTPGTDLIMNGLIYKPASVTPIGPANNDVNPAWDQARSPLAQSYEQNSTGERFTFIVNHFTSKGCSGADVGPDADQGDGQGCDNFQRMLQAQRLLVFIADVQASASDPDVIVMGDLNAYAKEDPLDILAAGGLIDQVDRFVEEAYSFVFDGQSGYLDHALGTASMSQQISGAAEWHINADEPIVLDYNTEFKTVDLFAPTPYRSSDHDPLIVGLELNSAVLGSIGVTPNPVVLGGSVNTQTSFTDSDPTDTHTAVWDWGDGNTSAGVVSEANGSGSVTGSHTYAAVGTYTITLTLTDQDGFSVSNTASVDVTYGICLLYDPSKAVRSGATYPIRVQICELNGTNVSASNISLHAESVELVSTSEASDVIDTGNANPDNNFRFDSSLGTTGGYVFNLRTTGLASGVYKLIFSVEGDPLPHEVQFVVK